jgi:hypothetical protein
VLNAHHELDLDRAGLERLAHAHKPAEIGAMTRKRPVRHADDGGGAMFDENSGRRGPRTV